MILHQEDFDKISAEFDKFENVRETVIKKSRDVVRLSKKVINEVHRGDEKDSLQQLMNEFTKLKDIAKGKAAEIGAYRVAVQETVEAYCFHELIRKKELPRFSELDVNYELYLLGIADVFGELGRKAVNSAIKGDFELVKEIKTFIDRAYEIFQEYDFRNGELRRKFDAMKYEVKKLEDLVFQLKLKNE